MTYIKSFYSKSWGSFSPSLMVFRGFFGACFALNFRRCQLVLPCCIGGQHPQHCRKQLYREVTDHVSSLLHTYMAPYFDQISFDQKSVLSISQMKKVKKKNMIKSCFKSNHKTTPEMSFSELHQCG